MAVKRYDRAYFDHWYRHEGFGSKVRLERKARYVLGVAEYLLDRPVRWVLDLGAGEGYWRSALRRVEPRLHYVGVEQSAYAVERYGRTRNLILGGLANLGSLDLPGPFDVVLCCDVLPYVSDLEARVGLEAIAELTAGVALLEVFCRGDDFEGDLDGFRRRLPATYEKWCADAGLHRIGPNLWAGESLLQNLSAFEGKRALDTRENANDA